MRKLIPRASIGLLLLAAVLMGLIWAVPDTNEPAPVLAPVSVDADATAPPTNPEPAARAASATTAAAAPDADTLMPAVSADVRGRRSSLQDRKGYAQRLLAEPDLAAFARELATLAAAGDSAAAATLSALYSICAGELGYNRPGARRCAGFGEAAPALAARVRVASKAWHQVASSLGDPASVLKVDYFDAPLPGVAPTPQELQLRAAATELFADGDYDALLSATYILAELSDRYDSQALEWALCSVRPACPVTQPQCPGGNRCMRYEGAPEDQFNNLTPRQSRIIAGQQAEIVRALQQGNVDALWCPLDLGEGG